MFAIDKSIVQEIVWPGSWVETENIFAGAKQTKFVIAISIMFF